MPQLNIETFVSQYFWLVLLFFTLYFLMSNFIIPSISENFKLRSLLSDAKSSKSHHLLVKDSSLIKDILVLNFNHSYSPTSYSTNFNRTFLNWSNKF